MKDSLEEAERAEAWQSVKALLIPLSLFLACLTAIAGAFLIYNQEPVGWLFLAVAAAAIVAALTGLIRFQNKYRAKGILVKDAANVESDLAPEESKPKALAGKRQI
jgi:uncharacterized protein involved in exopolysaccharide biosynthesis